MFLLLFSLHSARHAFHGNMERFAFYERIVEETKKISLVKVKGDSFLPHFPHEREIWHQDAA